jgi:branched-subunit amino acid ABC-type transport system permease component
MSSQYKDVYAFVILIIVLLVRPQGILGNKSDKV